MTATECITGRRSIRSFTEAAVSHELLAEVIQTASYAPSWKNTQVVRYIAVEGALKDQVASQCTADFPHNGVIIQKAPLLTAITVITGRCGFERDGSFTTDRKDTWQMYDAGIASQTFCLAAHENGLASVILGIFDRRKASALLELPEGQELIALIAVGFPAEQPDAPRRKPVDELLSFKS